MKKLVFLFASLFITVIAVQNVKAQSSNNPVETATAEASAKIIQVIDIKKDQDLSFGNIIASAAGGTVTIGTNGTPSYSGVAAPTGTEGTRQQATFTVTGEKNATFAITLPTSIEIVSGTDKMTVNSFNSNPNETGTLSSGETTLNVGAKLIVDANQATGEYKGSFDVKVNYN